MQYHILRLFLFALVALTIACGSTNAPTDTSVTGQDIQGTDIILRVTQNFSHVLAKTTNGESIELTLFADDHLIMLDNEMTDSEGQLWRSIVVDNNSDTGAEIYYIRANDLEKISTTFITEVDDADWSMQREARMTYCYKYVKQYLLKAGLVNVYLPGASAYMAANILPKHGFKKVPRKPVQAIVHDVCVYKGGPSGHGHIEVKTSKGWYYGYGYKKSPIQNRIFIGCFHK